MKSKKLIGILLSAALVFSVAMPTVLAAAADSEPDNTVEETSAVSESVEELASLQEEQEQEASSGELDAPADSSSDEKKDDLPASTGSTSNDPDDDFGDLDGDFDDPDDNFDDLEEEPFEHLFDCSDDCELDDCLCPCHLAKKLVEKILACTTIQAADEVIDTTPDYVFEVLTKQQNKLIADHVNMLIQEFESQFDYKAETVYETVDVTDVAPFGDPVVGGRD